MVETEAIIADYAMKRGFYSPYAPMVLFRILFHSDGARASIFRADSRLGCCN
jgi:hypothetical protein